MGANASEPRLVPSRLTRVQWLVLVLAALGFAFDIYELLMLPLIVRPALLELLDARPGTPAFNLWVGLLFYVPAVCGGVFGLLGGWLTDRFGRIRVLTWSILLYAGSALAAGFSTSAEMLLFFRCTTFVGVCVEFVAAVAWLAELFPEPRRREAVLGYTQAFSSLGGLLVTGAYYVAVTMADRLPAIQGGHQAWRYTLVSGVIPALPLVLIRPFLPESPVWKEKRDRGLLARPSVLELFRPRLRRTTVVTTILFACAYGAAFGALQHTPRMVPGLPEVESLEPAEQQKAVSRVQAFQEVGGLTGRFALAFLAVRIASRRRLLRLFQVPALLVLPFVFLYPAVHDLRLLQWSIFVAGVLVVGQFSFWGNYLPRVYPLHLRGTGESFATNIGGRLIGTSAALLTTQLALAMPGSDASESLAYAAAAVAAAVCVLGLAASFWLPEPVGDALPDE
jgi:hypothetical protein